MTLLYSQKQSDCGTCRCHPAERVPNSRATRSRAEITFSWPGMESTFHTTSQIIRLGEKYRPHSCPEGILLEGSWTSTMDTVTRPTIVQDVEPNLLSARESIELPKWGIPEDSDKTNQHEFLLFSKAHKTTQERKVDGKITRVVSEPSEITLEKIKVAFLDKPIYKIGIFIGSNTAIVLTSICVQNPENEVSLMLSCMIPNKWKNCIEQDRLPTSTTALLQALSLDGMILFHLCKSNLYTLQCSGVTIHLTDDVILQTALIARLTRAAIKLEGKAISWCSQLVPSIWKNVITRKIRRQLIRKVC